MTPVQFGPASSNQIYKGVLRELTLLREVCALYRHTPPKISRFRRGSLLQITTPDTVRRLRRCLGQTTQASSPCAQNHAKTTKKGGCAPCLGHPPLCPAKERAAIPHRPFAGLFYPFSLHTRHLPFGVHRLSRHAAVTGAFAGTPYPPAGHRLQIWGGHSAPQKSS